MITPQQCSNPTGTCLPVDRCPVCYPGDLHIHMNRDRLWCEALTILDPKDIAAVLLRFNSSRPDKE